MSAAVVDRLPRFNGVPRATADGRTYLSQRFEFRYHDVAVDTARAAHATLVEAAERINVHVSYARWRAKRTAVRRLLSELVDQLVDSPAAMDGALSLAGVGGTDGWTLAPRSTPLAAALPSPRAGCLAR